MGTPNPDVIHFCTIAVQFFDQILELDQDFNYAPGLDIEKEWTSKKIGLRLLSFRMYLFDSELGTVL